MSTTVIFGVGVIVTLLVALYMVLIVVAMRRDNE